MMKVSPPPPISVEAESLRKLIAYSAIGRTTVGLVMAAWLFLQGAGISWAAGGMSLALLVGLAFSWEAWKSAWKSATTRQRSLLAVITLAQIFLFALVLAGLILAWLSRLLNKDLVLQTWFPFH